MSKRILIPLPLIERARLAWEQLCIRDEWSRAEFGTGVTDSDVIDVIECWTDHALEDDYRALSALIWRAVEGNIISE